MKVLLYVGMVVLALALAAILAADEDFHFKTGTVTLPKSGAVFVVPPTLYAALGADARRLDSNINGTATDDSALEAVVVHGERAKDVTYLKYSNVGYVTSGDWGTVDADRLMANMKTVNDEANKERRANGSGTITLVGWKQPPTFDPQTDVVRWVVAGRQGPTQTVNATIVKLCRAGFEVITWAAVEAEYETGSQLLDQIVAATAFPVGKRYADHKAGDRIAGYGLSALVKAATAPTRERAP